MRLLVYKEKSRCAIAEQILTAICIGILLVLAGEYILGWAAYLHIFTFSVLH